jgi:site-specific DNA recombinase
MKDKQQILDDTNEVIKVLTVTKQLDNEIESLNNELNVLVKLMNRLIKENSKTLMNDDEYDNKYNELTTRYEQTNINLENLIGTKNYRNNQAIKMNLFKERIRKSESKLSDWNEQIWMLLIDSGIAHRDSRITFRFMNKD